MKNVLRLITVILPVFFFLPASGQQLAVKSNLLYDVTTTMNLGAELVLSSRWTLEISGNYNPWEFSGNAKIKHWMVQPEVRWWACQTFTGHFFGLHALGGQFNMGGVPLKSGSINLKDYRYQGRMLGAGISYGYHWPLSKHWGLEATLGIGYAHLDYDKYPCEKCGKKLGHNTKNYVGPTKAGINLIYIIK